MALESGKVGGEASTESKIAAARRTGKFRWQAEESEGLAARVAGRIAPICPPFPFSDRGKRAAPPGLWPRGTSAFNPIVDISLSRRQQTYFRAVDPLQTHSNAQSRPSRPGERSLKTATE